MNVVFVLVNILFIFWFKYKSVIIFVPPYHIKNNIGNITISCLFRVLLSNIFLNNTTRKKNKIVETKTLVDILSVIIYIKI